MSNPVIDRIGSEKSRKLYSYDDSGLSLTWDDIILRTGAMLAIVVAGAAVAYNLIGAGVLPLLPTVIITSLVGLGIVIFGVFRSKGVSAPVALAYAGVEGFFVGAATYLFANLSIYNNGEPNGQQIILSAVVGTVGVFLGMLFAYKAKIIRVTERFTKIIVGITFGLVALMLVNLLGYALGFDLGIRGAGPLGILFSVVCIVVAALNLTLDFNQGDRLIAAKAPVKMAWTVSLGLVVTIVWLYVEMLRIVSIFSGRD